MANSPMVMRSVYLPEEMDEQLRTASFVLRRPKADLIRSFVSAGLYELIRRLEQADTATIKEISEYFARDGDNGFDQQLFGKDLQRLGRALDEYQSPHQEASAKAAE